jgi:uncharacterized membrane protein
METKKSKYDTNPLDPDVVRKTEEVWGEGDDGPHTQSVKGATRPVSSSDAESSRSNVYSEAPTRRYDNPPLEAPYPSVFIPPTYSPPAQQSPNSYPFAFTQRPTSRPVLGIGLPEKWAVMLPYFPMYVGLVVSLIELFLVPRKEAKVRFHASQALSLHIAFLLVHTIFTVITGITGSSFGASLFSTAALVFLVISMIRVWQGKPHHIAPLDDPAQWFNEHIEPRNK